MTYHCETIPGHGHFLQQLEGTRVQAGVLVKGTLTERHVSRLRSTVRRYYSNGITQRVFDFFSGR